MAEEVNVITGEELDSFLKKVLNDQNVVTLFNFLGAEIKKESIVEIYGAEHTQNGIETKVLTLQLFNNAIISFTKQGAETKAISTVHLNGQSKVYQAVNNQVFPIVTTTLSETGQEYVHVWHENPIIDVSDFPKTTNPITDESEISIASCSLCTNICSAIQGTGCGLGATAGCMVICASFAGLACPFICAAVWGLKCLGDGIILCGPICEQLNFC